MFIQIKDEFFLKKCRFYLYNVIYEKKNINIKEKLQNTIKAMDLYIKYYKSYCWIIYVYVKNNKISYIVLNLYAEYYVKF